MYRLLYISVFILLAGACNSDDAQKLFELGYLGQQFNVPAGHSPLNGALVSSQVLLTNYEDLRDANSISESDVNGVRPLFATMTSLQQNLDFGFLSQVSIRVCDPALDRCTEFDEVFFLNDIFRRNLTTLRLDPGLRDVSELMKGEAIRMEVVLFAGEITPFSMDFILDLGFEAVK